MRLRYLCFASFLMNFYPNEHCPPQNSSSFPHFLFPFLFFFLAGTVLV